ncbi:MAG: SMC-Scp complex subunit ScpB [Terracidiphilus sp.]
MSLKAKLEAVIYAAEEPVTLTQLAALFAADALEWKVKQQADAASAAAETAAESTVPMPLLAEGLEYLGLDQTPAFYAVIPPLAAQVEQEGSGAGEESTSEVGAEPASPVAEGSSSGGGSEAAVTPEASTEAEGEAKRMARLRDREVKAVLRQLLDDLIASNASDDRGVEIREIAGGYRMATKPECHDAVRMFIKSLKPPMKLSLPALETLAVIAYKQPVTAPEVNEIRGVDSSGVFGSLLARKLITTAGRKPVIGRPILYKTTKEFLLRFGLKDVAELPSMEEFEKMAAIELEEAPDETGESVGIEPEPGSGQELDEDAPEDSETRVPGEVAPVTGAPADDRPAEVSPDIEVESTSAEAAPGEPSTTEQAETETSSHE